MLDKKNNNISNTVNEINSKKEIQFQKLFNTPHLGKKIFFEKKNSFKYISIIDNKYGVIKKIGEGATSKVFLGYPLQDYKNIEKKFYSIKILKSEIDDINIINNKIKILKSIKSPNVIEIYDYGLGVKIKPNGKEKKVYYIIMEFMEYGDLSKYLSYNSSNSFNNIGFGEDLSRIILNQLLNGLEAIHDKDIVHLDIKPENIMINKDYKIKFVDLGFATLKSSHLLNNYLGTPCYAAPEIHIRKPYYGDYADIFSLGITLFVLVTGALPFRMTVPNDMLYQFFVRNDYLLFWKERNIKVSTNFMELFNNLVAFNYIQRPSISEIRKSNWMKEINFKLEYDLNREIDKRRYVINQRYNNYINLDSIININNNNLIEINRVKNDNEIYDFQNIINKMDNKISSKNMLKKRTKIKEKKISITKRVRKINNIKTMIRIKVENCNLIKSIEEICYYLKKRGYICIQKNLTESNVVIKNEFLEIILFFDYYNKTFVRIGYILKTGTKEEINKLKTIIKNINFKSK